MCPWIWVAEDFLEESDHEEQLFIILLPHVRLDRYSVFQLIGKRNDGVVNKNDVFDISIFDDSEVFDVHSMHRVDAVLPVQSVLDDLAVWVDKVEGSIGIVLSTCRKYAYFVVFCQEIEGHVKEWTHLDGHDKG